MAIFLVDSLIEALEDLLVHNSTDPRTLLLELQEQEDDIYNRFVKGDLPELALKLYRPEEGYERDPNFDVETIWKGHSICRTGRLPAQARFLGHTTDTDKLGDISILGEERYDIGIDISHAMEVQTNGSMPLVYSPKEREPCDVVLKPDYKDSFLTHYKHGLHGITIPNKREQEAYGYNPSNVKGILLLVLSGCEWGKCDESEVREASYVDGAFDIMVNGERAAALESFGFDAWIVMGKNNSHWEPNAEGVFELSFQVHKQDAYLKISSIILY